MSRRVGRPRKLPVDEQRALILGAARRVFAESGPQAATVEQIAGAAGVTRQAVYETYGGKKELFAEAVKATEELIHAKVGKPALDASEPKLRVWARANYAAMFAFVAEHPDALPLLQQAERAGDPALNRVRARLATIYAEASRARWAAQGVESGRTDKALVAMYFAMTEALVGMSWDEPAPDPEALIDLLTEFTVGGVLRLQGHAPEIIARLR
ncbi:TetR/AcrR family transcriptional regulator [Amycolatopsis albispora]|uniref:TetR family transcriptional regulator n=1 Tax=Amycolatopsis albispora TaxID=1804986 RepID=A0A344LEH7_9PSEU|nr:TetR/AcrR family transcriptional regulator [Amycolatopsis albispora]AXB46451.1 TetR family transcriptional regulator [Amycolatopsis albispora]